MDVLTDLLRGAQARQSTVRQLIQRPPWALTFADPPDLTLVTILAGHCWIGFDEPARPPRRLAAGDIALLTGDADHTVRDDPGTPPQVVIRDGRKESLSAEPVASQPLRPRTYGDGLPGATVMVRTAYTLHGAVGARLLDLLPPLAIVAAGPRTRATLELLSAEVVRDEPGQDAVLHRLLDLLLALVLREWCIRPGGKIPDRTNAFADPAISGALNLLHGNPAHRWSVAELAGRAGMSRAAFAARFTELVGRPPLSYLTDWRMTLAADLLRDSDAPIAIVARTVGYQDAFAFSTAFKRARGVSPSAWRRSAIDPD
ncbi:AraC family transcriptional regulator [Nocardia aurantia]|uniref:IS5 family transposase IS4811 n=1 Tax=Nocardia aurantia TaxID=2585199 RepID=A0A7K0DZU8_9NOCA|nr:AraC family transcriptional regulator [Nocardia aurantia]MQY31181.1 IS5 family transposase IS4811 [Nocardia aurantia]